MTNNFLHLLMQLLTFSLCPPDVYAEDIFLLTLCAPDWQKNAIFSYIGNNTFNKNH